MNAVQHEAVSIVHAGLADILHWLGETPIAPWEPRHAAYWWRDELHTPASLTVPGRVIDYLVTN